MWRYYLFFFFFQAEDGIRDLYVTGVQTCALPISGRGPSDKVFEHQVAQEPEQQNEDHRRNVDPAEIGEHTADRPQQRLGYAPQEVPDCRDDAVVPVDDAASD